MFLQLIAKDKSVFHNFLGLGSFCYSTQMSCYAEKAVVGWLTPTAISKEQAAQLHYMTPHLLLNIFP